jgi:hypothetical protein
MISGKDGMSISDLLSTRKRVNKVSCELLAIVICTQGSI